ncbi:protein PRD1 [Panicum miliaceum]|uniref:Protein PRD1 n=1 Tax=Panicum miliaceum TaxID=4540 RepID=A0A3L6PTG4_PANMI|nr:protein PRD1 [Panicum miliaceum]
MESDGDTSPPPPPAPAPPRACGAGHRASHSLLTSAGGRVCLSCAAALLSSAGAASTPSHHVAHALASLSLALTDPAFLAPLRGAARRGARGRRLPPRRRARLAGVRPRRSRGRPRRLRACRPLPLLRLTRQAPPHVCRRQIYEGSSKVQMFGQSVKKVAKSTDDMLVLLSGLMLNQNTDSGAVQSEQHTLLRAIDLFFQESSGREQR